MYIEHATSQTSKSTNPKHVSFKGKSKIMIKGSKRQESSGGPTLLIPHLQSEQKKKKKPFPRAQFHHLRQERH
jgi:hypothetical protein